MEELINEVKGMHIPVINKQKIILLLQQAKLEGMKEAKPLIKKTA